MTEIRRPTKTQSVLLCQRCQTQDRKNIQLPAVTSKTPEYFAADDVGEIV